MRDRDRELLVIIGVGLAGFLVFALVVVGYLLTHE
jgi:hypothetical protein